MGALLSFKRNTILTALSGEATRKGLEDCAPKPNAVHAKIKTLGNRKAGLCMTPPKDMQSGQKIAQAYTVVEFCYHNGQGPVSADLRRRVWVSLHAAEGERDELILLVARQRL
jgi:hypothetical protein